MILFGFYYKKHLYIFPIESFYNYGLLTLKGKYVVIFKQEFIVIDFMQMCFLTFLYRKNNSLFVDSVSFLFKKEFAYNLFTHTSFNNSPFR